MHPQARRVGNILAQGKRIAAPIAAMSVALGKRSHNILLFARRRAASPHDDERKGKNMMCLYCYPGQR